MSKILITILAIMKLGYFVNVDVTEFYDVRIFVKPPTGTEFTDYVPLNLQYIAKDYDFRIQFFRNEKSIIVMDRIDA